MTDPVPPNRDETPGPQNSNMPQATTGRAQHPGIQSTPQRPQLQVANGGHGANGGPSQGVARQLFAQPAANQANLMVPQEPEEKIEYKLVILTEDNYTAWKWITTMVLKSKGLWTLVSQPNQQNQPREKQAAILLGTALNYDNMLKVINCQTAHEIWTTLETIYENKSSSEKQMLLGKFHNFKIQPNNLSKSLSELQAMAARLRQLGATVEEDSIMSIIMQGLPPEFNNFKSTWNLINPDNKDLMKLISALLVEAENFKLQSNNALIFRPKDHSKGPRQNYRQQNKNKSSPRPGYQKRMINIRKEDSPEQKERADKKPLTTPGVCNFCKMPGHMWRDCYKLKRKEEAKKTGAKHHALMALPNQEKFCRTIWIVDSGCTLHLTPRKEWIQNYRSFATPLSIRVGNDELIYAYGSGDIEAKGFTVSPVYYVPLITDNLFSIASSTNMGAKAEFNRDQVVISNAETGEHLITGRRVGHSYVLEFEIKGNDEGRLYAATLEEWHQRFGHISNNTIKRMIKDKLVNGLELTNEANPSHTCEACALGKCKNASHPTRNTPKSTVAGQILHFDVVGPMDVESLKGSRYYLLCKDEASSYRFVRSVLGKHQVPDEVKNIISQAEIETKTRALQIVSDNGKEFDNHYLTNFLKARGICQKFSAPYTPQQNGFIEREVRTISEAAKTMLLKSNLGKELWAEAVNTACYVMNRVPGSNKTKTPYEMWFGRKPSVKHLHVFGQEAVIMKPERERTKLSEKGHKVIFVGYHEQFENTYRFLDPECGRIIISCDAIFLYKNVPIQENAIDTDPQIVDQRKEPLRQASSESDEDSESESESDTIIERSQGTLSDEESEAGNPIDQTVYHDAESEPHKLNSSEKKVKADAVNKQEASERDDHEADQDSFTRKIDKGLYIQKRPPKILPTRLRSQIHHAKLTTHDAEDDPKSYEEAMTRSDKKKWLTAMKEEIDSLKKNDVWVLVNRPKTNVVTNKWVLKIKRKPDGSIDRYRARLVARGFSQKYGTDYFETFAPVANTTSIRLLFAHAAIENLNMAQFDVKTAFLYGTLDETVYMEQPEGFVEQKDKVCLLKRSLYGLKQSPRQWNQKFSNFLKDLNLHMSEHDNCIFYREDKSLIIAIYVDDGIIFAKDKKDISHVLNELCSRFEIHSLDNAGTFLGFQIHKHENGDITLHQESYVNTILKRFRMDQSTPTESPVAVSKSKSTPEELEQNTPYREAVGSLMYAAVTTRVDIAYAVNKVSRRVADPTGEDWKDVKRIFRYLNGNKSLGLHYSRANNKGLAIYCDSDYAGDTDTSRSTTGFVMMYGGAPIHWRSHRQDLITLSSTEAEFVSICTTIKELVWLRKLALELKIIKDYPANLYCDNQSAIRIACNEKSSHRTKHMSVQARYPREQVERGEVVIKHIKTDNQLADMLTKPTTITKFVKNRNHLMTTLTKAILAVICLFIITAGTKAYVFQRVSPLILTTNQNNYVINGTTTYEVDFTYMSPCEMIPTHPRHKYSVPEIYERDYEMYQRIAEKCNKLYHEQWTTLIDEILSTKPNPRKEHEIHKRSVLAIPVLAGAISGVSVTNLISTFYDYINPNSDNNRISSIERRQEETERALIQFENYMNETRGIEMKLANSMEKLENMIHENKKEIMRLSDMMVRITWYTEKLTSSIRQQASNLRHMIDGYVNNKVHTRAVSEMLNMTMLRHVDMQDTIFGEVRRLSNSSLFLKFTIIGKSEDTSVHSIEAFPYFDNLTDSTPTYLEYTGSRHAIYNSTSNCIKAIDETMTRGIMEECTTHGGTDLRLQSWKKRRLSPEDFAELSKPKKRRVGTNNYIYCYYHNVTIEGATYRCPPYVFKLKIFTPFSTGEFKHSPHSYQMTYHQAYQFKSVMDILPDSIQTSADNITETTLLDDIASLKRQISNFETNQAVSFVVPKNGPTTWSMAAILLIAIASTTLALKMIIDKNGLYLIPRIKKESEYVTVPKRSDSHQQKNPFVPNEQETSYMISREAYNPTTTSDTKMYPDVHLQPGVFN